MKWAKAWTKVGVDFYQFHIYDWVDTYWPHDTPASNYGLDKPIVMGELPPSALNGVPYSSVVQAFWDKGYAGAMPWMYDGIKAAELDAVKAFADAHACETNYTQKSAFVSSPRTASPAPSAIRSSRRCAVVDGKPRCVSLGTR